MKTMRYKLLRTGEKKELEIPKIDLYARIESASKVMELVKEYQNTHAILIYVDEPYNN